MISCRHSCSIFNRQIVWAAKSLLSRAIELGGDRGALDSKMVSMSTFELALGQKSVPQMGCAGKWKHGLNPAVPWWFNFDPYPVRRLCRYPPNASGGERNPPNVFFQVPPAATFQVAPKFPPNVFFPGTPNAPLLSHTHLRGLVTDLKSRCSHTLSWQIGTFMCYFCVQRRHDQHNSLVLQGVNTSVKFHIHHPDLCT